MWTWREYNNSGELLDEGSSIKRPDIYPLQGQEGNDLVFGSLDELGLVVCIDQTNSYPIVVWEKRDG